MLSFRVIYAQEGRLSDVGTIERWFIEKGDVELDEAVPDFLIYLHKGGQIRIIRECY